jgi:hypothetical protein
LKQFVGVLLKVVQALSPVLRNSTALYVILGVLTTAFTVLKVATLVSTVMQLAFNAALLLIPLAIIAIVAGVVILYKKWKWFHDAVNNTFDWIKSHWQLLGSDPSRAHRLGRRVDRKELRQDQAAVEAFGRGSNRYVREDPGFIGIFSGAAASCPHRARHRGLDQRAHAVRGPSEGRPVEVPFPALAAGGVIRASGAALVGEQGPEIVSLPRGATVWPTPAVQAMGANAPGAHPAKPS